MKLKYSAIAIIVAAALIIPAFGFADNYKMERKNQRFMKSNECRYGMVTQLTEEQKTALQKENEAFFNSTRDLRNSIKVKELSLESELTKKAPNEAKAKSIQKKISNIKAKLAQMKLSHFIKIKKIDPYAKPMMRKGMKKRGHKWAEHKRPSDEMPQDS